MSKISKTTLVVLAIAAVLMPVLVLASTAITTPTPPVTGTALTLANIEEIIRKVAQFLITVSVIIAVIFIIWGGVMYMAARGDDTKVEDAKKTIFNGIIGAAVVLGVGVILQTLAGLISRTFFG
jgi:phosphatidylglycerophosphatase A